MNKINYDPALEAPLAQEQPSSQQPKCLNCQEFIQPGQNSAVPIYLKQANNLLYFEGSALNFQSFSEVGGRKREGRPTRSRVFRDRADAS